MIFYNIKFLPKNIIISNCRTVLIENKERRKRLESGINLRGSSGKRAIIFPFRGASCSIDGETGHARVTLVIRVRSEINRQQSQSLRVPMHRGGDGGGRGARFLEEESIGDIRFIGAGAQLQQVTVYDKSHEMCRLII